MTALELAQALLRMVDFCGDGPVVVGGVVAATLLTVAFTFLLPRLHRPGVEA